MKKKLSSLLVVFVFLSSWNIPNPSLAEAKPEVTKEEWKGLLKKFGESAQEKESNRSITEVEENKLHNTYNKAKESLIKKASIKMSPQLYGNGRRHYEKKGQFKIQSETEIDLDKVNDRQILVKIRENASFQPEVYNLVPKKISKRMAELHYSLVRVPEDKNYEETLKEIRKDEAVEEAEPDFIRESTYIPSDGYYDQQWYLERISMEQAWDVNRGSSDVTVAVLDTGVNPFHPDLQGRVLPGFDFVNDDSDSMDDQGHGTHIAGIIAANSDQSGIAGVDHNAKILPVKVMNQYGQASLYDIVDGIYYSIEQGVDVINMSYGASQSSRVEAQALWDAYDRGIVLVAAAGNEDTSQAFFPASYVPVIGVAATDKDDWIADFSNFGKWIDITAPGTDMFSTNYTGGYRGGMGTSYSAPLISGVAALLKSENPNWGPDKIEWALEFGSTTYTGEEWNELDGYGKIDANNSLTESLPNLQSDNSDSRLQAEIIQNGSFLNEKVDLPMDMDWFGFEVEENSTVTIDLSNIPEHIDLVGLLYKFDGDTVLRNDVIDDFGTGQSEQYTFEADPGSYYLQVYDYYNHWSKEYYNLGLTVEPVEMDESNDGEIFYEVEPNDIYENADHMPFGMIGAGLFQVFEDFDVYKIDLPYNGDVVITTAIDNYAYSTLPIALFQPTGGDFYQESAIYEDSDSTFKYVVELFENVHAGAHYVVVANYYGYSETYYPYLFDVSYTGDVSGEVTVPQATVPSGTYYEPIDVELSADTDAEIKYTLDGSSPSLNHGTSYQGPIAISQDTVLKAVAIKDGIASKVVTWEYQVEQVTVDKPESSHPSGEYTESIDVELSSNDENVSIMYTLDGTTPDVNRGTLYDQPIHIEEATTLKAVAIKGRGISDTATFNYSFPTNDTPDFPDVAGSWAEEEINYLVQKNLIKGYPDGTFGINDNISRAEAATMIVRELELPLENGSFKDVSDNHWASEYIGAAAKAGIITGYPDETFDPNGSLSRQEMAAILVRSYNLSGKSTVNFTDVDTSFWSYGYIEKLVANNITDGYPDGSFKPKNNIKRSEFSVMVARVLNDNFKTN